MVTTFTCPDCGGSRVNERVRSCLINGKNIADVTAMPVPEALEFVNSITDPMAADIKRELGRRLGALVQIGLGYLSLSRGTGTLVWRRGAAHQDSEVHQLALTDMAYVSTSRASASTRRTSTCSRNPCARCATTATPCSSSSTTAKSSSSRTT